MNRELFIEIISDIQKTYDYQENLNSFLHEHGVEGYLFQPDCIPSTIKLLHVIFKVEDKDEWISYFCFELNFGRKWKSGMVKDENGKDILMDSPGALYDFLLTVGGDEASENMD
ncbi:MAG: hypothetical protein LUH21_04065 [Clostridiales bacterium]|nr:hypothetical protein [Clostridiales bacterium]